MGGDLASLHTQDVADWINHILLQYNQYSAWIGGIVQVNGDFKWSDGSATDYTNWQIGFPLPYPLWSTNVFTSQTFGWQNTRGDSVYSYVCQIPL
ncbi:hypothetical protein L596_016913 [Steinernema carpocapsae]|uniref:C-type lectin domain-containing protein n=1 Tax=Steinernema carpocapsae TaxID=34508 RepID=A0A4U5NL29_STECR|nr:hypothetical protein L596_016913 [Steinernema carpocapsae]